MLTVYRRGQGTVSRASAAVLLGLVAFFGVREAGGVLNLSDVLAGRSFVAKIGPDGKPVTETIVTPLWSVRLEWLETTLSVTWVLVIQTVLCAACLAGIWALMNHHRLVDFLIDTEDEMRKVHWPWDASARGVVWGVVPRKARVLVGNATVVLVLVVVMAGVLYGFDKFWSELIFGVFLGR